MIIVNDLKVFIYDNNSLAHVLDEVLQHELVVVWLWLKFSQLFVHKFQVNYRSDREKKDHQNMLNERFVRLVVDRGIDLA